MLTRGWKERYTVRCFMSSMFSRYYEMMKSKSVRWAGLVVCMDEKYIVLVKSS